MDFLKLLQITDSSFPLGGYAFSSGLESMAKSGLIRDLPALRRYLGNVLAQIMSAEVPFVNSAFRCIQAGDNTFPEVFRYFNTFLTVPTVRKASLTQGRSLMKIVRSAYPAYPLGEVHARLMENQLLLHFAPTFGVVAAVLEMSYEHAVMGYCYMSMRDQIYAAVRLGLLGPNEAQRLLVEQVDKCGQLVSSAPELTYHQAYKSCSVLEIAQAHHEHLYTKLFQS
jgi:urease accessory protein